MSKDVFKSLNDREHVLLRPSMYCGSLSLETQYRFIEGNKRKVELVPGLLKVCNELIDNSVDEYIRSGVDKINITIEVTPDSIEVSDTGRGIPVVKHDGELQPVLCWTTMKAGTSFVADKIGPSANGVGSVIAVIFSSRFIGETSDGSQMCKVTATNNMETVKTFVTNTKGHGTTVYMEPDFSRFEVDSITEDHILSLKERVKAISSIYPGITFTFNKEKIKCKKSKEYLEQFGSVFVSHETPTAFFGVFPTVYDEYTQCSNIDGLELVYGGTHEDYLATTISYGLRDLIKKKHKIELSPAEVKRGLMIVCNGRSFKNMKFESQTKERLSNTQAEVKSWFGDIPFDKLIKKIFETEEIIQPIIEVKLARQAAIDARAVTMAQKKLNTAKVKKHVSAQSKKPSEKIIFLTEGDSAIASLKEVRTPLIHGGYPLKGVPLNVYGSSNKEILENKELSELMAILGLQFGASDTETLHNLTYSKIAIMVDADVDGMGFILPMLLQFFSKWKILFEKKLICLVQSPLKIATKGKTKKYFYTEEEYQKALQSLKGFETRYIKGIGSLKADEYKMVINDESHFIPIDVDDEKCFDLMFSDNVADRKEFLKG